MSIFICWQGASVVRCSWTTLTFSLCGWHKEITFCFGTSASSPSYLLSSERAIDMPQLRSLLFVSSVFWRDTRTQSLIFVCDVMDKCFRLWCSVCTKFTQILTCKNVTCRLILCIVQYCVSYACFSFAETSLTIKFLCGIKKLSSSKNKTKENLKYNLNQTSKQTQQVYLWSRLAKQQ